jgi:predicted esterase
MLPQAKAASCVSSNAMTNPHLGQPILTSGEALEDCRAAALLFHGRGRTPDEMIALAARMAVPGVAYLAPTAAGNTWYPYSFLEPLERNEPALSHALAAYAALVADLLERGIEQRRLVLIGFSQGACLTAEYAVRHAGRYGGVALFTGGLIGPPGTRWEYPDAFDGTPIFMGGSTADAFVPLARMRESAAIFRKLGAHVTEQFDDQDGHIITDGEIAAARAIIQSSASVAEP